MKGDGITAGGTLDWTLSIFQLVTRLTGVLPNSKQHSKQQKVRHVVTVVDPKRAKEEREKAEEERIRGRESLFKRQVSLLLDNVATGLTTYPVLVRTLHAYTST